MLIHRLNQPTNYQHKPVSGTIQIGNFKPILHARRGGERLERLNRYPVWDHSMSLARTGLKLSIFLECSVGISLLATILKLN